MSTKNFLWSLEGKKFLDEQYNKSNRSTYSIATELNTYANQIRRALIYHKFDLKDKSEAQAAALKSGRHKHPTEGRKRTPQEKLNISKGVAQAWGELSEQERARRTEQSRQQWNNMPSDEKEKMLEAAHSALRKAAREGSKLEHYLVTGLQAQGYGAHLHGTCLISNESMEVDIYLPDEKIAIEIDGPSHYIPMWGEERLEKTMKSDEQKNGLLLLSGYTVIRIKHMTKTLSAHYKRSVLNQLISLIENRANVPKLYYLDLENA